ncbi:MAG TPA: SDR family oxidoreductase [Clostridiales bacterium]|nr:SDR family oxidoreductase [Clostridiales bacterium]
MSGLGRLKDKVALITGAANGIGYAMTKVFAQEGAIVLAVDINKTDLEKLNGVENVVPVHADITKLEDIDRIVSMAENQYGKLDILCNVAGINDLLYPMEDTTDEIWDNVMNLDLKAPFRLTRRAVKGMVERGSGVILNIGSYAGLRGNHGPAYTAAKHGLIGLTQSVAFGFANKGIRCNIINPGAITTDIEMHSGGKYHPVGGEMLFKIFKACPTKLYGDPEDIAYTALFLCSDEAKHVNGASVSVDGGLSTC